MIKSKQLTLDIQLEDHNTFSNFWTGNNQELISCLHTFSSNTSTINPFIYIWGPNYSGRSHLLHACCYEANNHQHTCFYLPLRKIGHLNLKILENLETISLVCLDDIQNISNKPEWEEAIFKLFNDLIENKNRLIVVADVAPQLLPITLPDLKSRLASGLPLPITPLNDEQKLAALQMRASQRGLQLSESVGKYLLYRYARDTKNLFSVLDKLDKESLISQHKLTIPFIKSVLNPLHQRT